MRLAKASLKQASSKPFDTARLAHLSEIMGRAYELTSMASTEIDAGRFVPVITQSGEQYSGFHSGAGETTMIEFLSEDVPKYSLVLIDEIETSLHPRAQRRLMRHLHSCAESKNCRLSCLRTHLTF